MSATFTEFYVQLVNTRTKRPISDDTGKVIVMTAGTPTKPTVYSSASGATASNPLTLSGGAVHFFMPVATTSVDLAIMTASGASFFVQGLTPSEHRLDVDPDQRENLLIVPFGVSDNAETDTGIDLPAGLWINPFRVALKVTTLDASEDLDVGLLSSEAGGDADGFIVAGSVNDLGMVPLLGDIKAGTGSELGALLLTSSTSFLPLTYRTDGTAKSLTYTGSATSDTAAGYILIGYSLVP